MGYISEKQLCILHTGYTPSRTKRKAERNLALLLTEMAETKQPENLYRYLAEAYEGLGDEKNAIRYARMDIANGPRPVTYASRCYRMLLQLLKNPVERFAVLEKARAAFPNLPEFHGEYLQWLMDDDILVKDKLVKMMQCFQKNPNVTMVTSERGCIDGNGQVIASLYKDLFPGEGEYVILDGRETGRATLLKSQNFLGEPSTVLFRRKDLQHHYWRAECRGYKTISDIAMGVPVITLVGQRHNSRFGYSLLMNIGLAECCAFSLAEYIGKATALAANVQHLADLHRTLRWRLQQSAIMDESMEQIV